MNTKCIYVTGNAIDVHYKKTVKGILPMLIIDLNSLGLFSPSEQICYTNTIISTQ